MPDNPLTTSVSAPTSPILGSKRQHQLDIRDFAGNAKRITVECNRQHLRISGNGNKVFVACNAGKLEVLGNGNRVKILDNSDGKVNIIGNNTKIYLCNESIVGKSHTNVKLTGLNGSVKLVSSEELRKNNCKTHPSSPNTTTAQSNDENCAKQTTSKTAPSSPISRSPPSTTSSSHHLNVDELLRQFDQQFSLITNYGISVNNINVSLDSLLPTTTINSHINCSSMSSVHIGTCKDVRLTAAKSSLVINHSS